jgi:hypothetical protein
LIVKVPWTICASLCLIIGMRRFMQSESVSLVELPACILEATRQMSDVNHTEVQRPARHTQHSRVGAVGEAADLPLKGSRKGEIGCRFGFRQPPTLERRAMRRGANQ